MSYSYWLALTVAATVAVNSCAFAQSAPDGRAGYFAAAPKLDWVEIGRSAQRRPIYQVTFGHGDDVTLIFGCFHGNEPATPFLVWKLAELLADRGELLKVGRRVVLVPFLNPDGYVMSTRNNANNVDLNRNYPTKNWGEQPARGRRVFFGPRAASEPETQVVLRLLEQLEPTKIISIHQPLHCNNNDGPAGLQLAQIMSLHNGYVVKPDIGYPTPGSFGTYAGKQLGIPMVTLELPNGLPHTAEFSAMWEANRPALLAVINLDLDGTQ